MVQDSPEKTPRTPHAKGADAAPAPSGPEVIRDYLTRLPGAPGVYRMLDAKGQVLYVGKARNLKARVSNYARFGGHNNRIARMIAQTASMEFVTTQTETEALLLEANLIKRLKPRFNVLMRDDKSFPYILVRKDHPFPQILKHRGARNVPGDYYGPFASAGAVNRTLNTLQKAFLLRTCTDAVFESRTRPCLLYQIKRCAAPCVDKIGADDYARLVKETRDYLDGRNSQVQSALAEEMEAAAEALEFERAAALRDRIRALTAIQAHQGVNPRGLAEADVFAIAQDGGEACVQVFFFRAGQNWGNRAYFPRADKEQEAAEILEAFLGQFYDDKPAPKLILLSHEIEGADLMAEALSLRAGHKVALAAPKRGEKREVVAQVAQNAREALARKLAESASQARLLDGVADAFGLDAAPKRIEVYDNSHVSGTNAVGGMIVAGPDGFEKKHYRKFNIKDAATAPGDDYAMMREVLTRRFTRLLKEDEARDKGLWPDLILVDGGQGQLGVATQVMADLGVEDVTVVGVAKGPDRDAGRERFFMADRPSFMLEPKSPVLYYLQRLRDEAHRFAIGAHRQKRSKGIGATPLDEIEGIGARRKRALLNHFGSARAVSRAGLADLEAVEGISQTVAKRIYDFFHQRG